MHASWIPAFLIKTMIPVRIPFTQFSKAQLGEKLRGKSEVVEIRKRKVLLRCFLNSATNLRKFQVIDIYNLYVFEVLVNMRNLERQRYTVTCELIADKNMYIYMESHFVAFYC